MAAFFLFQLAFSFDAVGKICNTKCVWNACESVFSSFHSQQVSAAHVRSFNRIAFIKRQLSVLKKACVWRFDCHLRMMLLYFDDRTHKLTIPLKAVFTAQMRWHFNPLHHSEYIYLTHINIFSSFPLSLFFSLSQIRPCFSQHCFNSVLRKTNAICLD